MLDRSWFRYAWPIATPPPLRHGRSVLAVFAVAAGVAVAGPLLGYRSDVAETRGLLAERLVHEAEHLAETLRADLAMLLAELDRLGTRVAAQPPGRQGAIEEALGDYALGRSTLFPGGVALVDHDHRVVFRMPESLDLDRAAGVIRNAIDRETPAVAPLEPRGPALVFAMPVRREGHVVGALVGVCPLGSGALELGPDPPAERRVIVGPARRLLAPTDLPPTLAAAATELPASRDGQAVALQGELVLAAGATLVPWGLRTVVLAEPATILAPLGRRFRLQLFAVASVQVAAVLVLAIFLRRLYRSAFELERRAAQKDKLAALGSAAALIAHEVKNALNSLSAAASLLETGAKEAAEPEEALAVRSIRRQVARLKHLATSLLEFGSPSAPQRSTTPLAPLVLDMAEALRALPEGDDVAIETALDQSVSAPCDPLLLATAIDNLGRNAVEAASAAKDLGRCATPRVVLTLARRGTMAVVTVEDNAGGPPPSVEARMFEPFLSGKPKGIGLGMAVARRAVLEQGGELSYARTAEGSRFEIALPLGPA